MRASRLLSILMHLQAKGQVNAQQLAEHCQVSLRTIYRDMDALSGAGIPLYSERGAEGGYRLLGNHRTQLNGLSADEAQGLFMLGLSGQAAELGLGGVVAEAQLKLLAALPTGQRDSLAKMSDRFLLDAPGWFGEAETLPALVPLAEAVRRQRRLWLRYRSWKSQRERELCPLGLVQKGGQWYLVGQVGADIRTYRVSRILDFKVLATGFERPQDFNLAQYWQQSRQRLEQESYPDQALLRLSAQGHKLLRALFSPYQLARSQAQGEPDAQGWQQVSLPMGSVWHMASELARLGAEVEVLAPAALRKQLADTASKVLALYRPKDS
ncbi:helix-turn-helix transcriptional regulator [Gallaecimonas xiamenensis]|nr:YafY family protein [Gallaecimonas xiamenensis]